MKNNPEDFICRHHKIPEKEDGHCWSNINILPDLIGLPWNEITMSYCLALNPSCMRVSAGPITSDSCLNRITVLLNDKDLIETVYIEALIPCSVNASGFGISGYELRCKLNELIKNKDKK